MPQVIPGRAPQEGDRAKLSGVSSDLTVCDVETHYDAHGKEWHWVNCRMWEAGTANQIGVCSFYWNDDKIQQADWI